MTVAGESYSYYNSVSRIIKYIYYYVFVAVSTFMLDTRLGTLSKTPNPEAKLAIENIVGLFR